MNNSITLFNITDYAKNNEEFVKNYKNLTINVEFSRYFHYWWRGYEQSNSTPSLNLGGKT
ncbi:hypothetical protein SLITO_v1c04570 [Spiroplasma litorale]|uniref:Uncharacterized protein n=1 Tax=Spiroplasma litorale TaxID=216942 RepID=A0A0K1W1B0_9MOLU|nr:hypothetical protein [Spiroplasma litorale]AKX34110.1 hypothetical protein SLITO_v1c04570 [Spiroplasma litorale]